MGILETIARATKGETTPAAAAATNTASAAPVRAPSQVWLNVGVTIPGAGQDGEDLFVSLPVGLAMDDMKPVKITGTNSNSIQLKQVKNLLLDELQRAGQALKPGERRAIPTLSVELYRIGQPDQEGTAENNPLIKALQATLAGK
jgi:hypothetical protein